MGREGRQGRVCRKQDHAVWAGTNPLPGLASSSPLSLFLYNIPSLRFSALHLRISPSIFHQKIKPQYVHDGLRVLFFACFGNQDAVYGTRCSAVRGARMLIAATPWRLGARTGVCTFGTLLRVLLFDRGSRRYTLPHDRAIFLEFTQLFCHFYALRY